MRITALGTGLPTPTTRAQKSTGFMVELGNGDVFLFDLGSGTMVNIFGLRPDFSKLDKVFLSHLHSDHFGDLDAFIVGSWLSGRYTPLHVYGGSGETPELGHQGAQRTAARCWRGSCCPRVRLPARRPGGLPGERRDHHQLAGHPQP
jgi:ribonuclease BN (tRNA processing enzyme)